MISIQIHRANVTEHNAQSTMHRANVTNTHAWETFFRNKRSPTRIKSAWKPFLGMKTPQNFRTCLEMIHGGSAEPFATTHRDDPSKLAHSHVGGLTRVDADSGAQ